MNKIPQDGLFQNIQNFTKKQFVRTGAALATATIAASPAVLGPGNFSVYEELCNFEPIVERITQQGQDLLERL